MNKVIGIDLGTTNSCVAIVEAGVARVLLSKSGDVTTPSVVATTDSGKRLVGQLAKRQAVTNPSHTVYGAKRLIGRRWDSPDVVRAVGLMSYQCIQGPHNDVRVTMGDKTYAVAEISSMVLQEMRLVAERALGESVSRAVITVPAYFNDNQRQATKDAGRIAGLDVLRIINEPTAAALAYGFGRDLKEQKVVVYDLGGGTFDISILELSQDVFEVLASAGDTFLGGEDFDESIIQWLVDDFIAEHKVDLRQDKMALQRLRDAAEKAKIELSSAIETEIHLPFIYTPPHGATLHLQKKMTRDVLNTLVHPLVEKTIQICQEAVQRAKIARNEISAVILVGGMTRMPLVQEHVQRFFGLAPSKGVHPDEVVACGAALQGHLLAEGVHDTLLLDVTPHDLGIMVVGGLFDVIIEKDTTIPTMARKTFTTVRDGQTQVRILVLQGDSKKGQGNELLGEFLLDGLRQAPRGEVRVEVTFEISADGIVSVSASEVGTGRAQAITVTASSGLTDAEILAMAAENTNAQMQAVASDAFESERVDVERLLRDIEKHLQQLHASLLGTDVGRDTLRKAQEVMQQARTAIDKRDAIALSQCREPLVRTASFLKNVIQKIG